MISPCISSNPSIPSKLVKTLVGVVEAEEHLIDKLCDAATANDSLEALRLAVAIRDLRSGDGVELCEVHS
jgi:hypothetical protein